MGSIFMTQRKKDNNVEETNNINENEIIDYSYLQTVQENKNFLTKEEVSRASKARRYQLILGWPSTTNYLKMVENNMITNCDINTDNIKRADIIWRPAEYVLQGEMKMKKPNAHNNIPKLTLPLSVSQQHKKSPCTLTSFMLIESLFSYQKQGN